MKYTVCFTKYYNINVEADNEEEAIDLAEELLNDDYDEVEVW